MNFDNLLLNTDSYKVTHWRQYPPNTTQTYCYFESRGGPFNKIVFYGLQYIIKKHLSGRVVTPEKIVEAKQLLRMHFSPHEIDTIFNGGGWNYILKEHNGHLPIRIKALPEGSIVTPKNVLLTVENTDPKCFWLPTYIEGLLVQVWYPMTVATSSRAQKELIFKSLAATSDKPDGIYFKLHDFGFRGSTCVEAAALGGSAHLVNFRGTDTLAGVCFTERFYPSKAGEKKVFGHSIPAAEHSTITAWTQEGEVKAYENMLKQWPKGMIACVSDSYDIDNAVEKMWGEELRSEIVERGARGGVLVVRPDSGEPKVVVVDVLDRLEKHFGCTKNKKGFKVLPDCIRVIQGDGINIDTLGECCDALVAAGWSLDNIAFGSGGALLQKVNRDTLKCAYKLSNIVFDDKQHAVFKCPKGDAMKKSKKGRLAVVKGDSGGFETIQDASEQDMARDELVCVFENGLLVKEWSFDEVVNRAEIEQLKKCTIAEATY